MLEISLRDPMSTSAPALGREGIEGIEGIEGGGEGTALMLLCFGEQHQLTKWEGCLTSFGAWTSLRARNGAHMSRTLLRDPTMA